MKTIAAICLFAISSLSAYAYEVSDLTGTYQGRHKVWGQCFLEIKSDDYYQTVTVELKKNSGQRFTGLLITKANLENRLADSPSEINFSADLFRATPTTCLIAPWAAGCRDNYYAYSVELDEDGQAKDVVFTHRYKQEIHCRNLKKISPSFVRE